jgi:hypothetical protein
MTPYAPTPKPEPVPDWMKNCNVAFFGPATANPITLAYCAPGGSTSEIRYQWWPNSEGDVRYDPEGKVLSQWMADSDRVSFEGAYEHKKVISISEGPSLLATVWVRFWDENGFVWDSPALKVGSV